MHSSMEKLLKDIQKNEQLKMEIKIQQAQEERKKREQEEKKRQEENRLRNTYGTLLYSSAEEKLLYAISFEIYEDIDKWLNEVKDINYKGLGMGNGSTSYKGKTALYLAAGKKDEKGVKVVEKLLNKNANPELECTTFGSSYDYPIHNAAANGSEGALKLLLNSRVNLNQTDSEGETPLMKAVRASTRDYKSKDVGYNTTTFFLREANKLNIEVNINYVNEKSNWTALHYAVIANYFDIRIVEYLLSNARADSKLGYPLSFFIVQNIKDEDMVLKLFKLLKDSNFEFKLNLKDHEGIKIKPEYDKNLLNVCKEKGLNKVIAYLEENKLVINENDVPSLATTTSSETNPSSSNKQSSTNDNPIQDKNNEISGLPDEVPVVQDSTIVNPNNSGNNITNNNISIEKADNINPDKVGSMNVQKAEQVKVTQKIETTTTTSKTQFLSVDRNQVLAFAKSKVSDLEFKKKMVAAIINFFEKGHLQDMIIEKLVSINKTHQECFENTIKSYEKLYKRKWGKDLQTFIDGISPGDKYSVKQALEPLQDNYKKAKKELINHCTKDIVYNQFIDKLEKDKELDLPDILIDCFKQTIEPDSVSALLNIEKTKKLHAGNDYNHSIELSTSAGNSSDLAEKASSIADNQAGKLLSTSDNSKKESRNTASKFSVQVKSAKQTHVGDSYDYSTKVTEMTKTIDSTSNQNIEQDWSQARLVTQQGDSLFRNTQVTSSITKTSLPMPKTAKKRLVEEAYNLLHNEYDQNDIQENEQLQLWEKLLFNYKQKEGALDVTQVAEVKDIIYVLNGEKAISEHQIDAQHKVHIFMEK